MPFADCLNHTNVATKYDLDVASNGMFRLFPSGANAYAAGKEVFNSYGRRSNFQLLLDYGFALPENEWDYVDVELPKDAVAKKFPFLRRLQLDRRSSLEELFPVSILGAVAALSPTAAGGGTRNSSGDADAERVALQTGYEWLRSVLVTAVEKFGCSIEEVELQLSDADLPARRRAALVYHASRMKIVEHVIRQIDAALDRIKKPGSVATEDDAIDGNTLGASLGSLDLNGSSSSSS